MAADRVVDSTQDGLAGVIRRHVKLIGLVAAVALALGVAAALALPPSAKATATVLITPLDGNPYAATGRGDDLTNLQTEAQLVSADTTIKLAAEQLGHGSPESLRSKVSVEVPPNTQILVITFEGGDARAARDGAKAFATSYLDYRKQRAQGVLDAKTAKLQAQKKRIQKQLDRTNTRLSSASGAQRTFLEQRLDSYTNQIAVIDEKINDLTATPVRSGQVITPAQLPDGSNIGHFAIFGGVGLVLGLLGGLAMALVLERSDRRLGDVRAVQRLGVPVLSAVPALGDDSLALISAPRGAASEAYRKLRAAIVAAVPQRPVTLLVTNATPSATATLTSSNLAVALAHAGSTTIMVDAAFSETNPSVLFGLGHSRGLSDVLLHGTDPTQLLVHADSQLRLLPRGSGADAAAERFSGPRMRETVHTLGGRAEYIVLNAPSVHDANAQALCTLVDAVLLVVTLGVTTRQDVVAAYTEAERAGAVVIGTVVETSRSRRAQPQPQRRRPASARTPRSTPGRPGPQPHPPGMPDPRRPSTHRAAPQAPASQPPAPQAPPSQAPAPQPSGSHAPAPSTPQLPAPQPEPTRRPASSSVSAEDPSSAETAVQNVIEA